MTQAVYYEAAYEPLQGRRAVAQVVLNRVRHPAFPNSVCGVVYQGSNQRVCQFSFTCDGSLNRKPSAAAWPQPKRSRVKR
jgi:spore germination cell wall hydrolase CwlJ-like protein